MIVCRNLTKEYEGGRTRALDRVSFRLEPGTFTAVTGRSGSGKTTLMNLIAALDRPTDGEVEVGGIALSNLGEAGLSRWRGRNLGVVFQFFQLLPTLTIAENVLLPMEFTPVVPVRDRMDRVMELLDRFGIADQADKLPHTLSGGQQQRAAVARALANDPPVLVADEPTGNLDSANTDAVLDLFAGLARQGKTVVMVTHETDFGVHADRQLILKDGRLVEEVRRG
jgi:putative ABC transport system ATP-binding protein